MKWGLWGALSFAWFYALVNNYEGDSFDWSGATHGTGELAWKCLLFTVFISLLQKLFPRVAVFARLLPLRKYTGIFAFLIAFSHVISSFFQYGVAKDLSGMLDLVLGDWSMLFGAIAFLAMLPAFITSTNWAVKKMGYKFWKNIQRLTHLAFVFTVLHLAFLDFYRSGSVDVASFVPLGLYGVGYGYLFIRKKVRP